MSGLEQDDDFFLRATMVLTLDGDSENRCALQEKSLLFDQCKAYYPIEGNHKSDFFL